MRIKCIIVDDEPLAIALLKKHVKMVPELELISTCSSAMEAFSSLQKNRIDLMFLDIQMPVMTGMELLKTLANKPNIILTTAYRDYAIESYEWNVTDYLLKPIAFPRFLKSVQKVIDETSVIEEEQSKEKFFIFVKSNRKQVKIDVSQVTHVESIKDYIRIHMTSKSVVCKEKISAFLEKLPDHFLRIHRSYIVNQKLITAFSKTSIQIGGIDLPIGISYKVKVDQELNIN